MLKTIASPCTIGLTGTGLYHAIDTPHTVEGRRTPSDDDGNRAAQHDRNSSVASRPRPPFRDL
jgi:hypothetical protein